MIIKTLRQLIHFLVILETTSFNVYLASFSGSQALRFLNSRVCGHNMKRVFKNTF